MQYTIRSVPQRLDWTLRERARSEGKSLNQVALEALGRGAGCSGDPMRFRDLSDLAGSWKDDPEFDRAIEDQDSVDRDLWR